jgi:hypothetical protein
VKSRKIAVVCGEGSVWPSHLLEAVGPIFDVEFCPANEITGKEHGALFFNVPEAEAERWAAEGVRGMWFARESAPVTHGEVEFSRSPYLAKCFRGRKLRDKSLARIGQLVAQPDDEILARLEHEPYWIVQKAGAAALDKVALQPPALSADEYLYPYLEKDNWARLLPLLHFLRGVSGWQPPPLRACLMFDDPNLHWPSYGYLRYRELAQHAREHNYHAALATIPMDCWYVHPEAAQLFREEPERLSLLFHGNNHTYYELTQAKTKSAREALVAQAIRRVERFEKVSGVPVARAMAAPHGACSLPMADVLLRSSFEVACISRSSLMARNPEATWPKHVGMTPAEFVGNGLPVIPRFNLRWDSSYALFAGFLGQPIILVGHHDDVGAGLDLLSDWANFINGMGETRWCDVETMARSNYSLRQTGAELEIQMFSRKVDLVVPAGCARIYLRRPWLSDRACEELQVIRPKDSESFRFNGEGVLSVTPGERVLVSSIVPDRIDVTQVPTYLPGPWAITRRQLCEVRDRLRPVVAKLRPAKDRVATNN